MSESFDISAPTNEPRRSTAELRRQTLIEAAVREFARTGMNGASTEAISTAAGVSHTYLFKLFGSKKRLFLDSLEYVCRRIGQAHAATYQTHFDNPHPLTQSHYVDFARMEIDRSEFLLLLQGMAAADDAEIGEIMRRYLNDAYGRIQNEGGATAAHARTIMAEDLLRIIGEAVDLTWAK